MVIYLAIDSALLERAFQVSGERTKKATVAKALQEFIARREQRSVGDLLGKLERDPSFDYKGPSGPAANDAPGRCGRLVAGVSPPDPLATRPARRCHHIN